MFLLEVKPWKSSEWVPPKGEELITADKLRLDRGARTITKKREAGAGEAEQKEHPGQADLPDVPIVTDPRDYYGVGVRGDSFMGQ